MKKISKEVIAVIIILIISIAISIPSYIKDREEYKKVKAAENSGTRGLMMQNSGTQAAEP